MIFISGTPLEKWRCLTRMFWKGCGVRWVRGAPQLKGEEAHLGFEIPVNDIVLLVQPAHRGQELVHDGGGLGLGERAGVRIGFFDDTVVELAAVAQLQNKKQRLRVLEDVGAVRHRRVAQVAREPGEDVHLALAGGGERGGRDA